MLLSESPALEHPGDRNGNARSLGHHRHFVKPATAARHPKTTMVETTGGTPHGRSAITGQFVKDATVKRHPDTTVRHGS
jgi:hypothetical protein